MPSHPALRTGRDELAARQEEGRKRAGKEERGERKETKRKERKRKERKREREKERNRERGLAGSRCARGWRRQRASPSASVPHQQHPAPSPPCRRLPRRPAPSIGRQGRAGSRHPSASLSRQAALGGGAWRSGDGPKGQGSSPRSALPAPPPPAHQHRRGGSQSPHPRTTRAPCLASDPSRRTATRPEAVCKGGASLPRLAAVFWPLAGHGRAARPGRRRRRRRGRRSSRRG